MIIIREQMILVTYAFEESAALPRPNRCVLLPHQEALLKALPSLCPRPPGRCE